MGNFDDDEPAQYASPPCFMHELDPAFRTVATPEWADVRRWRKAERERLIEQRLAISADARNAMAGLIAQGLDQVIGDMSGKLVSLYWPFRGEPDLRPWLATVHARGGNTALPIAIELGKPLIFRAYAPGDKLERGVWNIPIPAAGPEVIPDVVIAPLVGFDAAGYRLGYGGGFFDRTLAALPRKALVIGIGYEISQLPTIYPQAHDIAMDRIVTEAGVIR
ncbi:5-formyltetrahydrofolate cyclo-ligase [Aminobacter sp. HY435]|uniref:5-formyltetrahydrofolate cyclo-ligase n=1 Tax=Aminobacter sp. HY435 TaxID=2970917 RepID=UPI0022B979A5|nr:5-formyltetrahydrofolate cyclo-ligase [Aminobacter sp. HY435]